MREIEKALACIDVSALEYEEWLDIGMALKDYSLTNPDVNWKLFDNWSASDIRPGKYPGPEEIQKKWNSFNSHGITIKTLYWLAFQHGYRFAYESQNYEWDDVISYDGDEPERWLEAYKYIKALFRPEEYVSWNVQSRVIDDRHVPSGYGSKLQAEELLRRLEKEKSLENVFGDYEKEAGGWIHFNPMDGTPRAIKDENITAFRYCLIESDELDINDQIKKILELRLPCAALVASGNKSIHAIVHVDAQNSEEYRARVKWIYEVLKDNGFPVDKNNKNPSRYSRLPGLQRGDNVQSLIDFKAEFNSFAEWEDYIKNGLDDEILPEIVSYADIINNPPPLREELIEGVLRQGHKMIIAGASKSGKSFSLIDLMCCIAEGKDWLGFKCKKGRVLYLNFEIDEASFWERIRQVYEKHGWEATPENIDVWNLRGHSMPAGKLVPKVIRRAKDRNYSMIILDPIYKIQAGDENAAGDIAKFTNEVDRLANELGASVVYCHHHSKGQQGFKRSMDRASGSGVFSRDPDAILDVIELSNEGYRNDEKICDLRAFRIEGTLREFPSFEPVNVFYDFPIYRVDRKGILSEARPLDEKMSERQSGRRNSREKRKKSTEKFIETVTNMGVETKGVAMEKVQVAMNIGQDRLKHVISAVNKEAGKKLYRTVEGVIYSV